MKSCDGTVYIGITQLLWMVWQIMCLDFHCQGSHRSWKVLKFNFFLIFRPWKVLKL